MYRLMPKKTNNKAQKIVAILFFAAAALMLLSAVLKGVMPYVWTIQLLSICFLVGAIFLVSRYLTKIFVYEIAQSDGGIDFAVSESYTSGKRFVTVCRIGLNTVQKTILLDGERGKSELAELKSKKYRVYDYRPDLLPEKSIALVSDEGGNDIVILLAYDGELLSYFTQNDTEN